MLYILNIYSQSRKFWVLLLFSTIILESIALFIQYFFLLKPCVLCIYQRCALCGIMISGIVASIAPYTSLRFLGISIWIYSAFKGLCFAKKHAKMILYPSPFLTCDLFVKFPTWLPLNKWWPAVFNAYGGDCFSNKWYFLSLEMSQWMVLIFTSYLIIALIVTIAQFVYFNK